MNVSVMLAEPIERLFAKQINRHCLLLVESGDAPLGLWQELQEQGVTLAMVPESSGGAGMGWSEVAPVLRLLGVHAAPVPLGETMLAAAVLAGAGLEAPPGPLALATGIFQIDADGTLSGRDPLVAWASQAEAIVVIAMRGDERYVAVVDPSSVTLVTVDTHARIPSSDLEMERTRPLQLAPVTLDALGLLPGLATLRAAQIAGSLETVLALSVEYANTRTQFGKPIGKFQAIQQHLAELAMQAAAAQVAVQYGCRCMDSNDRALALQGAAVAKQRASRSATLSAGVAHQVFGAIGVTDEHLLHFHTRRLWQWRAEGGSEHFWAEHLGRLAMASGGPGLWPLLVGQPA